MSVKLDETYKTKVLKTFVSGDLVYSIQEP